MLLAWLAAIGNQLSRDRRGKSPVELLRELAGNESLRRCIRWQGMLAVQDAFPDRTAQLNVDILNPHHKSYYEGNGSPHDAENPFPVFFLVLAPGARFTFSVKALPSRDSVWEALGDWRRMLDAAFDRARDWLGFGAKTAVGYGAFEMAGPASDERAAAPSASREGNRPIPAINTSQVIWRNAIVSWNAGGGGKLTIVGEGKKTEATGPAAAKLLEPLTPEVQTRLKKKGLKSDVRVEVSGNHIRPLEILAGKP